MSLLAHVHDYGHYDYLSVALTVVVVVVAVAVAVKPLGSGEVRLVQFVFSSRAMANNVRA